MAHVQLARDVRGRQADRVLGLGALWIRGEKAGLLPKRVPTSLDGLRVICGWHGRLGICCHMGVLRSLLLGFGRRRRRLANANAPAWLRILSLRGAWCATS